MESGSPPPAAILRSKSGRLPVLPNDLAMTTLSKCVGCGSAVDSTLLNGLCSRCALQGALDLDAVSDNATVIGDFAPRPFGDYELLEEIARGGMGIVYKARQKSLDRIVAIKLLAFGTHADADMVKRFRVEAVAAGSLNHPNIVAIHEVGIHEGQHFLVMDYVDGPNLARFVRDQPLPARRAAEYLKAIAEAIH